MAILKNLLKWEQKSYARAINDEYIIDLQVKRVKLIYDSLMRHGFNEDQATLIVSGILSKQN